ncbi:MAG: arsenite methyltransferase [Chloroflexi bacterium]|nr:arsenite methyltransferase [Chloroflexota bacterium]
MVSIDHATGYAADLYSSEELKTIPKIASEIALGCGNPTAIADLKDGEIVLDLGCGGGIDCFLAAKKVGAKGKVIGLDIKKDMISLAWKNAILSGITNVEFRLGEMESIPVDDGSIDVVISNCVINLSPNKDKVFKEIYRVLKPGGRLCVSDIVTLEDLPRHIRENLDAWAACVAGALDKDDYLSKIKTAGFDKIKVEKQVSYSHCCPTDQVDKIVSISISAYKNNTIKES